MSIMAFHDRRQPGLSLDDTKSYFSLKTDLANRRALYAEAEGLALWQKSIERTKSEIKAEKERLADVDLSEFIPQAIERTPSGLPKFLKTTLYGISPGLFPGTKRLVTEMLKNHQSSSNYIKTRENDVKTQEKLLKEYTTLRVPTSNSEEKMSEMYGYAKTVFDNMVAPLQHGPQLREISRLDAVIEGAIALKSSNRGLHREREIALLNESSQKTGDLPYIDFAPDGNVVGTFLKDETGPQTICFDDTYWAVLQSEEKNYLVPRPVGFENCGDMKVNYTFKGNSTYISLASENQGNSFEEISSRFPEKYYDNEFPHTKVTLDTALVVEIDNIQNKKFQENAMKGLSTTLKNLGGR